MNPSEVRARVQVLVDTQGLVPAARSLQLAPATLARLLAGTPVTEGTLALCAMRLGLLVPATAAPTTLSPGVELQA
jgi:hypothetical protein